ncbi:MAG: NUDIX hydrolase [candidate division WOR-3 bacterium]
MSKESVTIYDENLKEMAVLSRDEAHQTGGWHRSIHCWIIRPIEQGYVLFQKRGRDKKLFPNFLDITAAGHYKSGESAREGTREILEELRVDVKFEDLIPLGIKIDVAKVGDVINREFCDVFILIRKESPEQYNLDPSEVEGLVQIKINDGLKLFGGEVDKVTAEGIEWSKDTQKWRKIKIEVSSTDFIPRIDPYYYKIFIMAKLVLAGEKYISI